MPRLRGSADNQVASAPEKGRPARRYLLLSRLNFVGRARFALTAFSVFAALSTLLLHGFVGDIKPSDIKNGDLRLCRVRGRTGNNDSHCLKMRYDTCEIEFRTVWLSPSTSTGPLVDQKQNPVSVLPLPQILATKLLCQGIFESFEGPTFGNLY